MLQTIVDALSLGGLYALTALGVGLIFSVMRLANFAHGELITCAGYAMFTLSGQPVLIAIGFALLVSVAVAVLTERLAFHPLRHADPATLLIASFTVSMFLQKLMVFLWDSRVKPLDPLPFLNTPISLFGSDVSLLKLVTVGICGLLLALLTLFLGRSSLGMQMRAAAEDFTMSRLLGVRATTVVILAFVLSAVLAVTVAVLFIAQTGFVHPRLGVQLAVTAFVATVIGGLGSLPGAVLGGFVVGVTASLLQVLLPASLSPFRDAFLYLTVILILLAKPNGLLSARGLKERI